MKGEVRRRRLAHHPGSVRGVAARRWDGTPSCLTRPSKPFRRALDGPSRRVNGRIYRRIKRMITRPADRAEPAIARVGEPPPCDATPARLRRPVMPLEGAVELPTESPIVSRLPDNDGCQRGRRRSPSTRDGRPSIRHVRVRQDRLTKVAGPRGVIPSCRISLRLACARADPPAPSRGQRLLRPRPRTSLGHRGAKRGLPEPGRRPGSPADAVVDRCERHRLLVDSVALDRSIGAGMVDGVVDCER